jgi:hypothetical protein
MVIRFDGARIEAFEKDLETAKNEMARLRRITYADAELIRQLSEEVDRLRVALGLV